LIVTKQRAVNKPSIYRIYPILFITLERKMLTTRNIAFFAVMLLYLCFPFSLIFNQEKILTKGELHLFRSLPIDPYDAFRGRYVALSSDISGQLQDRNGTWTYGEKAYVTFKSDSLGYAIVDKISISPPEHSDYLHLKVMRVTENEIFFTPPENMQRYYMNEKLAPKAEQAYRDLNRRANRDQKAKAHLEVRIWKGECLIEDLYLDGMAVGEYLESYK